MRNKIDRLIFINKYHNNTLKKLFIINLLKEYISSKQQNDGKWQYKQYDKNKKKVK